MIGLMRFEWLKLRKRWMARIILLLVIGLTILAFWAQATRTLDRPNLLLPRGWLAVLSYCSFFAPFFWPVLGGSWGGSEYGWGTIRMILTRRPFRIQYFLGALIVLLAGLALAIFILLVIGTVASIIMAALTGNSVFISSVWSGTFLGILVKGFAAAWYVSAFFVVIAYSAAVLFRSTAVGIGLGIGSTLAEIVLTGIFAALGGTWNTIAQHFPFIYARDMITQVVHAGLVTGSNLATTEPGAPSATQSIIALAIYGGIMLALSMAVIRRRDVTA
jgi:ABC-2 type transport system permease protein